MKVKELRVGQLVDVAEPKNKRHPKLVGWAFTGERSTRFPRCVGVSSTTNRSTIWFVNPRLITLHVTPNNSAPKATPDAGRLHRVASHMIMCSAEMTATAARVLSLNPNESRENFMKNCGLSFDMAKQTIDAQIEQLKESPSREWDEFTHTCEKNARSYR